MKQAEFLPAKTPDLTGVSRSHRGGLGELPEEPLEHPPVHPGMIHRADPEILHKELLCFQNSLLIPTQTLLCLKSQYLRCRDWNTTEPFQSWAGPSCTSSLQQTGFLLLVQLCCASPCHRMLWLLMLYSGSHTGCPGQEQKSSEASKDIKSSSCLRKPLLLEAQRSGKGQPGLYILWFLTHLLWATCKSPIEEKKV